MKLLQELNMTNPSLLSLTDMQKGALLSIKMAATPNQGYEATSGSENAVAARKSLEKMGLIEVRGNQAITTKEGNESLVSKNLVDETGQPTEDGQSILDEFNKNKEEYINLESFDILKSINS